MDVVSKIKACLRVHEVCVSGWSSCRVTVAVQVYQKQFQIVKSKVNNEMKTRRDKPFQFPESKIFRGFNVFSQRLEKLLNVFSTMEQFQQVYSRSFWLRPSFILTSFQLGKQDIDGVKGLMVTFDSMVKALHANGRYNILNVEELIQFDTVP